jgi:3-methyladenine DNA glycosylase AlkD
MDQVLLRLRAQANPANVAGMARYGINPQGTLGISIPTLRQMAKEIGRDHPLAQQLWASGIHEARILAAYVDDPRQVTEAQMDQWVAGFDSWDVCDQVCCNLFDRLGPLAYRKAPEWAGRPEEFVRRAGFTLMAALAWHDKAATDDDLAAFLPAILMGATDKRNFVKKAVSWALRHIGKRNQHLNGLAIATAEEMRRLDAPAARWIAGDVLRELTGPAVQGKWAVPTSEG